MSKFDIAKFAASLEQPPEGKRDIKTITAEILRRKRSIVSDYIGIGRCLIEAKEVLPHGEWLPWLEQKAEFSERYAQGLMRIAREWSNPQSIADLGITKVFSLLALPEGTRDEFIGETHTVNGEEKTVYDMTARELKQAIRERDEARRDVETALAEAEAAEESRAKMQADMEQLKALQEAAQQNAEQARAELEAAQKELEDLRAKPVEVAVEKVVDEKAIQQAREQAVKEMQAKVDKAEASLKTAEKKLEDLRKEAQANAEILSRAEKAERELAETKRLLEDAAKEEKQTALNSDPELAVFQMIFEQTKGQVNQLHGILMKMRKRDEIAGEKLKKAMLALADIVRGCAE